MKILGIDPGLSGALVFYNSSGDATYYKMPLRGKSVDVKEIYNICKNEKPDFALVEKQFILKWQKGNMTTIGNYHRIFAALEFADVKYKIVTARSWQKALGIDKERDGEKLSKAEQTKKEKALHIQKALDLGFNVPRKSSHVKSPYHDGIADAYLIARSYQIK